MNQRHRRAVAAEFVFDGRGTRRDSAVVIEGSTIVALAPRSELPASIEMFELPAGAWLAPGFIDVQVNGGGDVLFNAAPTPEGVFRIVRAHRKFGTTALLPTLITDTDDTMQAALSAVEEAMTREPSVLGIHFEGPFLSPEKPGVHQARLCRPPEPHHMKMFTRLRRGTVLVTLAPEQVPQGFIAGLAGAGVKISLGHSMATYRQTRAAMAEGLTGFTHLFNAMRPMASREPGPVAAALESPKAFYGLIVDGQHVALPMLRLAMRAGLGHAILVTDAMPPVGGAKQEFELQGQPVLARNGRCATAQGVLAGSAIDMASAVRNCVELLQLPLERALAFASTEPADFLGLGHWLGRLAPGYRADMVAFYPEDLKILGTWTAGEVA